jgi:N-acetyl sugar amidotransferase
MSRPYQLCTRCIMDTSASKIVFDEKGICNYCAQIAEKPGQIIHKSAAEKEQALHEFIAKVKADGKGKRYDCVIGVSGGIDSSWVLVQAVKLGLRPLAVHMDNGWNSELAQNNIANLIRTLGVDLYTHVIDWNEYRALMQAFLDADVVDIELLYDNAMFGVNYFQAKAYGVKYIIGGMNTATEGMRIPEGWYWSKFDTRNIKAIGKKFGGVKIKTFPLFGIFDYLVYERIRKIKWYPFLDYFEYNKQETLDILQRDFGYKPYPYKHYESIFTRFYQGYILPRKFNIDKRRMHLSSLIMSGQMTREDSLRIIEHIPYPSQRDLDDDIQYFLKKMGWTKNQLEDYLQRPRIDHRAYPSYEGTIEFLSSLKKKMKKLIKKS